MLIFFAVLPQHAVTPASLSALVSSTSAANASAINSCCYFLPTKLLSLWGVFLFFYFFWGLLGLRVFFFFFGGVGRGRWVGLVSLPLLGNRNKTFIFVVLCKKRVFLQFVYLSLTFYFIVFWGLGVA